MAEGFKTLKIRIGGVLETPPFPYTYEEQFIVRFPESIATQVREELRETGQPGDLKIIFIDARRATVSFRGEAFLAVLLDLPAIIESHKTIDRSQYYKIADISQMLLVVGRLGEEATETKARRWEELEWQHPDGLTPPMKSVRTRRFRNTLGTSAQQREVEALERKVQALIDRDNQSISSAFTVFDNQGRAVLRGGGAEGKLVRVHPGETTIEEEEEGGEVEGEGEGEGEQPAEDEEMVDSDDDDFAAELEEQMLADEVETVDEEHFINEDDQTLNNKEDALMADNSSPLPLPSPSPSSSPSPSPSLSPLPSPVSSPSPTPSPTPSPAVLELQSKINERKAQLESVTNPLIKARLEDVIRQLENDLQSRLYHG